LLDDRGCSLECCDDRFSGLDRVRHYIRYLSCDAVYCLFDVVARVRFHFSQNVLLEVDVVHLGTKEQIIYLVMDGPLPGIDCLETLAKLLEPFDLLALYPGVVGYASITMRGTPGSRPKE